MNKTALITGAAVGIGRGIAETLADNGYDIAIHYNKSRDKAEKLRESIREKGCKSEVICADLSHERGPEAMIKGFKSAFDRMDIFVNNSGLTKTSPFLETTYETFNAVCDLNLKGSYFCVQGAAKYFVENKIKGNIIIISSNHDCAHFANASVYGSIKAGLSKMAEHAALELSKYNIRVNTIAPGWTDTGNSRLGEKEDTYYKIPLKRWCLPHEIGKAVLFLSSLEAGSITGARIVIDGGALLLSDLSSKYGL